jgi:hypothetical protein
MRHGSLEEYEKRRGKMYASSVTGNDAMGKGSMQARYIDVSVGHRLTRCISVVQSQIR